ncbi:MAG: DUF6056 family protein [Erysipelotrichaceae bacterium]|nr:DUF6056 family protein [Erysipelotrichaceae bacterium]
MNWKIEQNLVNIIYSIYNKLEKYKDFLFLIFIIFSSILLYMWVYFVPYNTVDDYQFMHIYCNESLDYIKSISDIVVTQAYYYFNWSGRVLLHGLLQFLLMIGKPVASLVIVLSIDLFAILASKIVDKNNKINKIAVLIIIALYYFLTPTWDELVLWVTGAIVYTIPITFVLAFLYLYTSVIKKCKLSKFIDNPIVFGFLGFIAGCSNEHVCLALDVVIFFTLIYFHKNNLLNSKHIIGYVSLVLGSIFLMIAPGNYARSAIISEIANVGGLYNIVVRISSFIMIIVKYGFPSIILMIITYVMANKEKLHNTLSYYFMILGFIEMIVMLGVPQGFPPRTYAPCLISFIISSCINVSCIDFIKDRKIVNILVVLVFIAYITCLGYYAAFAYMHPTPAIV